MSKIVLEPKGEPVKRPDPESVQIRAAAFAQPGRKRSKVKYRPLPASAWQDKYWLLHDKLHSARVALMAAEATLSLCAGKVPPYVEDRRAETVAIVRKSLKELDG